MERDNRKQGLPRAEEGSRGVPPVTGVAPTRSAGAGVVVCEGAREGAQGQWEPTLSVWAASASGQSHSPRFGKGGLGRVLGASRAQRTPSDSILTKIRAPRVQSRGGAIPPNLTLYWGHQVRRKLEDQLRGCCHQGDGGGRREQSYGQVGRCSLEAGRASLYVGEDGWARDFPGRVCLVQLCRGECGLGRVGSFAHIQEDRARLLGVTPSWGPLCVLGWPNLCMSPLQAVK